MKINNNFTALPRGESAINSFLATCVRFSITELFSKLI